MEETYKNYKSYRLEACRLLAVCTLAERIDGNGHDAHSANAVDRRQSAGQRLKGSACRRPYRRPVLRDEFHQSRMGGKPFLGV